MVDNESTSNNNKTKKNDINDEINSLLEKIRIARYCRFFAGQRLENRQVLFTYIISYLSLYVIFISYIPSIFLLTDVKSQVLQLCSTILSTLIIVVGIIESSQNFNVKCRTFLQDSQNLSVTYHKLKAIANLKCEQRKIEGCNEIHNEYSMLISNFSESHSYLDYKKAINMKNDGYEKNYNKFFDTLYINTRQYCWMLLTILPSIAITIVIIKYILISEFKHC